MLEHHRSIPNFQRSSSPFYSERAVKRSKIQQKIIAYITKHGEASTNELVDYLGISRTAVQNNIKKMTEIMKWTGKSAQDPQGKYVLKQ